MSAWTQQRGNRHRALYRDAEGKTRSAGTFPYEYQALEAAQTAELEVQTGTSARVELAGLTVARYATVWLGRRTAIEAQTRSNYSAAVRGWITLGLGELALVPPADAEERRTRGERETWLSRGRVRGWVAGMEADPAVGISVRNNALRVLRMVCKAAREEDELIKSDPTAGIKRQPNPIKPPRAFLSDEEIEAALEATRDLSWLQGRRTRITVPGDGMLELALLLGLDAGLRWSEISALDLASVRSHGSAMSLYIHRACDRKGRVKPTTKNHRARTVPVVTDRLRRALSLRTKQARLEHGPGSLLIYRADGSPALYDAWNRTLLHGVYDQAGVTAMGWHDLRHTFGSRLAQDGTPTQIIATVMGHLEEEVTQLYMHPSATEHLATVMGRALSG